MRIFNVHDRFGCEAQLWSDDTFTLHFGEGFEDQVESTEADLSAAVSRSDLERIAHGSDGADSNDQSKAAAALAI